MPRSRRCRRRRPGSTTRPRSSTSPRTGLASPSSRPMSRGRSPRDPPKSGEVVQAGQPIFTVARHGRARRRVRRAGPGSPRRAGRRDDHHRARRRSLGDREGARADSRSPQADPVTRTFRVRLSLIDHPEAMRLGATVTGRLQLEGGKGISIPASALTATNAKPAVWVVDPAKPDRRAAQCRGCSASIRRRRSFRRGSSPATWW